MKKKIIAVLGLVGVAATACTSADSEPAPVVETVFRTPPAPAPVQQIREGGKIPVMVVVIPTVNSDIDQEVRLFESYLTRELRDLGDVRIVDSLEDAAVVVGVLVREANDYGSLDYAINVDLREEIEGETTAIGFTPAWIGTSVGVSQSNIVDMVAWIDVEILSDVRSLRENVEEPAVEEPTSTSEQGAA